MSQSIVTTATSPQGTALIAQMQEEARRGLLFTYKQVRYVVNVPVNDIRDRGHGHVNDSPAIKARIRAAIMTAIDKWIAGNERHRCKYICDFGQDVLLLWHMNDPLVVLLGAPDTNTREPRKSAPATYQVQILPPEAVIQYVEVDSPAPAARNGKK